MGIENNTPRVSSDRDVLGFLNPACVVKLPGKANKNELLAFMVETLAAKGQLPADHTESVITALVRRERLGTTGLGRGIALPHLKWPELDEFAGLIGIAENGVEFDSLDHQPTHIVVLIISPSDQPERHLEVLGHLAKLFSDKTTQYFFQLPRSPESTLHFFGIGSKGRERGG